MTDERIRETKPCCVADEMWRVRQVEVAGRVVGIANLGEILEEVKDLDLATDTEIRTELLKRVKEANYVPRGMDDVYADAVLSKYRDRASQRRGCCGN